MIQHWIGNRKKSVIRIFWCIYIEIAATDLDFMLTSGQNWKKKKHYLRRFLSTITQEGDKKTLQMTTIFSSTLWVLTDCDICLCFCK